MKIQPIKPLDIEKCQAEITPGSFMTLGPRIPFQCIAPPDYIVVEKKPHEDGSVGAMSLCADCLKVFERNIGDGAVFCFKIKERTR